MGIQYICENKSCSYPGNTCFEIKFNSESIMDSNNIASVFCPFCKQEMNLSFFKDRLTINGLGKSLADSIR